ncbi:arylphorin subunit alpha-like [Hylaeus anthracinus]|uniref:arylphorin subunit alpha-like n=1 Tax=Hylaeus anthracinus TaxID=313031 RepID=UPI0023B9A27B|nr:arylphorin subunit alpha-like [Hylaeus anthracinus]
MLKITLLVGLVALCVVQGMSSAVSRTADMEFLQKQKKIYELLLYIRQNDLIDAEYYELGRKFNPESNIDLYNDQEAVQQFIWSYKNGLLLSRNAVYTTYNYEHRMEMKMLFEVFYSAKDFQTFYKTACWARINVNPGVFTTAFTVAVFYRNDCKYMKLPPIYEIYPNLFFSSKVIQDAQDFKMGQGYGSSQGIGSSETYKIYANYSSAYMPDVDSEYKLDYFMEDVELNSFYYYYQQVFPFWLSSKYFNIPKEIRGQFYYFFYKQLMGRYYLERMSQGLGEVNDFDWYKPIYPGYYSTLTYSNGVPVPQRNKYSDIPYYKYKHLQEISVLEARIMDAIDSGYFVGQEGKQINFYSQEGLGMLANVIEGNEDSYNKRFYGRFDALARDILGFSPEYSNKNNVIPSALQSSPISMRDPAFYMLYKRVMSYFFRYHLLFYL